MVDQIEIPREGRAPSRILVGDVLRLLPAMVPADRKTIVVTDVNVARICEETLAPFETIVIPTGEEIKTMSTVECIHRRMIDLGADRRTFVVGVGGGIVTDITGFAASTWMRGTDFGFVSTTLLGQVDASVGGKNGVNVGGYKNMAGVFNQPDWVLCDTGVLDSLPPREIGAGLAEMIKAGVIGDAELFEMLHDGLPDDPTDAIARAIRLKARIVEADERESGERRKLNLGHTIGHAVEKLTRQFNHGEAVAIGMAAVAELSVRLGACSPATRDSIVDTLRRAGLPTRVDLPADKIAQALAHDKKVEGRSVHLVVVREIGRVEVRDVALDTLAELL